VGLTTEPQQKEAGPMTASQEPISDEVQAKIDNLRLEIIYIRFLVCSMVLDVQQQQLNVDIIMIEEMEP